ncbi:HNH endonuclease [Aliidiomarina celeris]|uniref:HNH endonuclease n=1 Tax=Aliidiomarina celeris TaxID=2249428 RepID=UPI0018E5B4EF|nr:HNH endonuclease signature motif containing protein [Aliidiomarina celeris]
MVEVYKNGDLHVWIPVAAETDKYPARAFLPINGLNEAYLHGYKAEISESKYLEALCDIQNSFLSNESKVFTVNGGKKEERQYKAKWRHGRQKNSPLLGPTKGWVKVNLADVERIDDAVLAKSLDNSDSKYSELESSILDPILCGSDAELAEQAQQIINSIGDKIPMGQVTPKKSSASQEVFLRDAAVVAYVLNKAGGVCECCNEGAPFLKKNEEPFLEVHHVKHLADGGSDTIQNTIAVCPNCHRELHYGAGQQALIEKLYSNIERLICE